LGGFLAFLAYKFLGNVIFTILFHPVVQPVFAFLNKKWYFDKVYDEVFMVQTMLFGRNVTFRLLDQFVFEQFGPEGLRTTLMTASRPSRDLQNGFILNYAALFLYGLLALILALVVFPKLVIVSPGLSIFTNAFTQLIPIVLVLLTFS